MVVKVGRGGTEWARNLINLSDDGLKETRRLLRPTISGTSGGTVLNS